MQSLPILQACTQTTPRFVQGMQLSADSGQQAPLCCWQRASLVGTGVHVEAVVVDDDVVVVVVGGGGGGVVEVVVIGGGVVVEVVVGGTVDERLVTFEPISCVMISRRYSRISYRDWRKVASTKS